MYSSSTGPRMPSPRKTVTGWPHGPDTICQGLPGRSGNNSQNDETERQFSLKSDTDNVAGENLKGSTVTARACLMGACLI